MTENDKWKTEKFKSKQDWFDRAEKIFKTKDYNQWIWVCPSCDRQQKIEEFEPFKDQGASPNSAYTECLGRYNGGRKGSYECDWASYGLFQGPDFVTNEGNEQPVFKFFDNRKK